MKSSYRQLKIKEKNNFKNLKILTRVISKGEISSNEAYKLLSEFKKIGETLDNAELVCTKSDGSKYDFNRFLLPLKFIEKTHNCEITLDEATN